MLLRLADAGLSSCNQSRLGYQAVESRLCNVMRFAIPTLHSRVCNLGYAIWATILGSRVLQAMQSRRGNLNYAIEAMQSRLCILGYAIQVMQSKGKERLCNCDLGWICNLGYATYEAAASQGRTRDRPDGSPTGRGHLQIQGPRSDGANRCK